MTAFGEMAKRKTHPESLTHINYLSTESSFLAIYLRKYNFPQCIQQLSTDLSHDTKGSSQDNPTMQLELSMPTYPRPDPHDRLKHFKNDGPGWRLAGLFLEKLPSILASAGALVFAF